MATVLSCYQWQCLHFLLCFFIIVCLGVFGLLFFSFFLFGWVFFFCHIWCCLMILFLLFCLSNCACIVLYFLEDPPEKEMALLKGLFLVMNWTEPVKYHGKYFYFFLQQFCDFHTASTAFTQNTISVPSIHVPQHQNCND